jgi:phosphotransferase system IIA component
MSKELEALEKLNHTICLNSPVIKWGVDTYDHIDCKSESEFAKCYKIVLEALDQKAKQEKEISALDRLCENQDKLNAKQYECISDLIIANEKQKKIIDVLKDKEVNIANVFGVMTWFENDKEACEKYNIYSTLPNIPSNMLALNV